MNQENKYQVQDFGSGINTDELFLLNLRDGINKAADDYLRSLNLRVLAFKLRSDLEFDVLSPDYKKKMIISLFLFLHKMFQKRYE